MGKKNGNSVSSRCSFVGLYYVIEDSMGRGIIMVDGKQHLLRRVTPREIRTMPKENKFILFS